MFALVLLGLTAASALEFNSVRDQLIVFRNKTKVPVGIRTTPGGAPICYKDGIMNTLNSNLLNSAHFMTQMSHFTRERIPERVVHAKGSGAFGYFEVTKDVTNWTNAAFLSKIGKKTDVVVRFSPAGGEKGISDAKSEIRSFAIKFYTEEGNLDIPGLNIPTFFTNEPTAFVTFAHSRRRNPRTNFADNHAFFDVLTQYPEAFYSYFYILIGHGTPASYQEMPGFGVHTYQFQNSNGTLSFGKCFFKPCNGTKTLTLEEAAAVTDPDFMGKSLFKAIEDGNYPCWTLYFQMFTEEQADELGSAIADVTRVFSEVDYPLQEVGKVCLNRNPDNFFAEVEQLAFSPSNVVRGFEGGLGILYEARRFAYPDTQIYRLGVNNQNIGVNYPYKSKPYTYNRDGVAPVGKNGAGPNYEPNTYNGPIFCSETRKPIKKIVETRPDNLNQTAEFYNNLTTDERDRLIESLVTVMVEIDDILVEKTLAIFKTIDSDLHERVQQGIAEA